MRLRGWAAGGAAVALLAMSAAQAAGPWTAPLPTDKVEGGVNWSTGVITAKAMGVAPQGVSPEHGRALAITAGTVLARQELLAIARGVAIDGTTTVQALMVSSAVTNARVQGVIRGAQVVDVKDVAPGVVEVTVAVPATGEFADLVLPRAIAPKPAPIIIVPVPVPATPSAPTVAAPAPTPPVVAAPAPVAPAPAPPVVAAPPPAPAPVAAVVYSGLVIDARGLGIKPAMAPKVLSEAGQEVYGGAVVDRNWVVQHGMAGYSKDLPAAQAHDRVTSRPLTVKAVGASGAGKTDVVISNTDAQLLIASGQHLAFLEKARVMFVVD